jgi:molybdopterin/thiamine biosynthesis adenylyltransferase
MDLIKHRTIFDPTKLNDKFIAVVGVGALGCAVLQNLARLGCKNINLYDPDVLEFHNLPNQYLYTVNDVGRFKVEAAAARVAEQVGESIVVNAVPKYVNGIEPEKSVQRLFESYVFVCVDSMAARSAIFGSCRVHQDFYGEARMGSKNGASYYLEPRDPMQRREYQAELYSDDEVTHDRAACGTIQSVGPTAQMLAAHLALQFVTFVMQGPAATPNEVMFSVDPWTMTSRQFKTALDLEM